MRAALQPRAAMTCESWSIGWRSRILHIAVLVAHDVVVAHEDRALGALGIHAAAPPDGLALEAQQHGLMHVEGPAVIAGEPGHVGRVRDDDEVEAPFRHGGPCLARCGDHIRRGESAAWPGTWKLLVLGRSLIAGRARGKMPERPAAMRSRDAVCGLPKRPPAASQGR